MPKGRFVIKRSAEFRLTDRDLKEQVLVVDPDMVRGSSVKDILSSIGFSNISLRQDHLKALEDVRDRPIKLALFSTSPSAISALEFCQKMMATDPGITSLPMSFEPGIDDVFGMLRIGCLGYIVMPPTADSIESSVLMALKGTPLSDALLNAPDLNLAFSAIIAGNLDKYANVERQRRTLHQPGQFHRCQKQFQTSVETGRLFASGGAIGLRDSMIEFFINLATGPASRLGRLRQELKKNRAIIEDDTKSDSSSPSNG